MSPDIKACNLSHKFPDCTAAINQLIDSIYTIDIMTVLPLTLLKCKYCQVPKKKELIN